MTLTVEIGVGDRWSLDTDMKQIRSQAIEAALQELHNGASVAHNGRYGMRSAYCVLGKPNWALIGEPKVEAVIVHDSKADVAVGKAETPPAPRDEEMKRLQAEVASYKEKVLAMEYRTSRHVNTMAKLRDYVFKVIARAKPHAFSDNGQADSDIRADMQREIQAIVMAGEQ